MSPALDVERQDYAYPAVPGPGQPEPQTTVSAGRLYVQGARRHPIPRQVKL